MRNGANETNVNRWIAIDLQFDAICTTLEIDPITFLLHLQAKGVDAQDCR